LAADGTSELTLVLISAGAALLGAIIGGLITGIFTYNVETRRDRLARQREADRERALAVATAVH
jgi:hypothetical protein